MAHVLITGGARGIGLELAKAYLAAGNQVTIGVRNPAVGAAKLPGAQAIALDVTDAASVAQLARALSGQTLDVLINNAGVIGPDQQSTTEMDFEGFLETLNVNTVGPLRVTQALTANLKRSSGAKVAIISSQMGSMDYANSDHMAYRASKAAVNKVVQCLATDLASDGVAVVSLHPGWVRTEMGGPGAALAPEESAASLKRVIDGLTLAGTGRFLNYDGRELAW